MTEFSLGGNIYKLQDNGNTTIQPNDNNGYNILEVLRENYGKYNGCTAMMKLIEKTFIKFAGGIEALNNVMNEAGV